MVLDQCFGLFLKGKTASQVLVLFCCEKIGSDLSLHGEGPGRAGTGQDAPDVKPVRLLSSLLAGSLGGRQQENQAGHQEGGDGGGGGGGAGGGWEHLRVV